MTEAPELREMDDPEGMAIHNATQAIYDLFEVLSVESAHWLATVAIINAEREARIRHHGHR